MVATLDGRRAVLTGGEDGSVRAWDPLTGTQVGASFRPEGAMGGRTLAAAVQIAPPYCPGGGVQRDEHTTTNAGSKGAAGLKQLTAGQHRPARHRYRPPSKHHGAGTDIGAPPEVSIAGLDGAHAAPLRHINSSARHGRRGDRRASHVSRPFQLPSPCLQGMQPATPRRIDGAIRHRRR
jgi:hypothetical protein